MVLVSIGEAGIARSMAVLLHTQIRLLLCHSWLVSRSSHQKGAFVGRIHRSTACTVEAAVLVLEGVVVGGN